MKAAKLSSLSVEETSKSYVLHQLPSRYSNYCNELPQVDVTDLLFSVDKSVVLHSLNLFGQPDTEYKFTVFVAKVRVYVCVCVCLSVCMSVYVPVVVYMSVCAYICAYVYVIVLAHV